MNNIQEVLKITTQVWSGHPCEIDYLHYDHDERNSNTHFRLNFMTNFPSSLTAKFIATHNPNLF